jgi:hypothetical protein
VKKLSIEFVIQTIAFDGECSGRAEEAFVVR